MKHIFLALFAAICATAAFGANENIARGKPYSFGTPPNYSLCRDAGDLSDLTDGVYTKGYFWTQKSTVGWSLGNGGGCARTVTVDLGKDEPISGFSWNMAAGAAGVAWPELLFVYVSVDGKEWRCVGDLFAVSRAENGAPPKKGYAVYRAHSGNMPCHGRYVKFLVVAENYAFVDEIEVYGGPAANLSVTPGGGPVKSALEHYARYRTQRLGISDVEAVIKKIDAQGGMDCSGMARCAYLLNAEIARNRGFTKPFLWSCGRWDNVDMVELLPSNSSSGEDIAVRMMRGETRSAAVNLSNPTDRDISFTVGVVGLPDTVNVECREVLFTCHKDGRRISGALKPGVDGKVSFDVPAGTVKQVWISFVKPCADAGEYSGRVVASSADGFVAEKGIKLVLSPLVFPSRPRLHVGGWDYSECGNTYFSSPGNLAGKMREMKAMFVDTPWATRRVAPTGAKFAADGALLNPEGMNFKAWDDWVSLWNDTARQFCVYIAGGKKFHDEPIGTDRFNRMVGEYMNAWYAHAAKSGLNGRTVYIHAVDEPRTDAMDRSFIAWAKAIKSCGTGFRVFVDPDRADAEKTLKELFDVGDVICPKTLNVWQGDDDDFYRGISSMTGKELWLYSCNGPSRTFDPISYYRVQAWRAWSLGAKGSFFWAFGCGGGIGDSWRPFDQPGTEYSPFFVSPDDAMSAKQSMAIMEGVEDYEYLAMLADKIADMKAAGKDASAMERLLSEAPQRVIGDKGFCAVRERGSFDPRYDWDFPKNRTAADRVRLEILDALEQR